MLRYKYKCKNWYCKSFVLYINFDDFTTVLIDKELDEKIVGLISENYLFGIALKGS